LGHPHPAVSSVNVGSLLGASKVSRFLGGMAGSSILGRPWLCVRMETINVDGGGAASSDSHIHMLVASLMPHQAPSENIAGHLASKSAGHVNKQALPYCPAPREHIAVRSMDLKSTDGSYAWNEQHEGCHAQNASSVEGLGNVRASGRCCSRGEPRPLKALSCCGYYTGKVRPVVSRFFLLKYLHNDFGSVSLAHRCIPAFSWRQSTPTCYSSVTK